MAIDLGQINFGQIRRSEHLPARIAARLAEEISQLIYHLQVLMLARGLQPTDIYKFL